MENEMMTLEELHAHYKAVRSRLDNPVKKEPAVRLICAGQAPYPDPLNVVPPKVEAAAVPAAQNPLMTSETPARRIMAEVAEKHNMPMAAFRSASRTMPFVNLRHEACYRLSIELGFSLKQIGRLMGNRDHTTVMNAINRHKKILVEGYKPKTRKRVTGAAAQAQIDHV
jgi:hypothetical protein